MYYHLEKQQLLPKKKTETLPSWVKQTKDQLLIDKVILRNCRRTKRILAIGFIDYKIAYDMVLHSWL